MTAQQKKKFPGIFIVIAVSFVIYLTVVSIMIYAHYIKKAGPPKTASTAAVGSKFA